jgi:hypothetical protein
LAAVLTCSALAALATAFVPRALDALRSQDFTQAGLRRRGWRPARWEGDHDGHGSIVACPCDARL